MPRYYCITSSLPLSLVVVARAITAASFFGACAQYNDVSVVPKVWSDKTKKRVQMSRVNARIDTRVESTPRAALHAGDAQNEVEL